MVYPKVGTDVEVVLDTLHIHNYLASEAAHRVQATTAIEGTVVEIPKWMKTHADLALYNKKTKSYNYIPAHRIISIGGIKVKQPKVTADKIFQVTSSKTGELYTVRQDGRTKRWSCTCIGFQFHKKCRHATRLAEAA